MPKKLPLGLQDFRGIIEGGYKYIDKTRYLYQMASSGKYFFLSRPRRFGKSITIATLHELYSGSRALFEGLWIADKWDWNRKNPVLRISFTAISYQSLGLRAAIEQEFRQIAAQQGLALQTQGVGAQFRELIAQMSANGKVVVLVDEYDAPIIHYLGIDLEKAKENREILREMYTVLKDSDPMLEFVFLTGVSKFSKTGIFSGLNNLTDLTMHPEYATMLGYTQAELEHYFSEEIEATAAAMNLSREALLDEMKTWYNGYRFEENAESVYNPGSVNLFFDRKEFQNFWFATGTPTFLINLLKKEGNFQLDKAEISALGLECADIENIQPCGLLYQTGYLTIQARDEYGLYHLDYPNREVKLSMEDYILQAVGSASR